MRLCDKDALMDDATVTYISGNGYIALWRIDEFPEIDPDSLRPKGRWVGEADGYFDGELVYDVWYCSECNHCIDDGTDDPKLLPNFCPNCGADMRDEK